VTAFVNRSRARQVWTVGQILTRNMSLDQSTEFRIWSSRFAMGLMTIPLQNAVMGLLKN
jgi:hypothetical protein